MVDGSCGSVLLHLGALAAPIFFTWKGVLLTLLLGWVFGGLGICLGYHRLLTHQGFQTYGIVRRTFAWLGSLSGEGPPITWIALHRKHHQFSDQEGDPHSPRDGGWWSHMLWIFPRHHDPQWSQLLQRYAPDLLKDRFMWFLDRSFLFWHLAVGALLWTAGWFFWDWYTGLSFVVLRHVRAPGLRAAHDVAGEFRVAHLGIPQLRDLRTHSRKPVVGRTAGLGEGWHNNHHAAQRCARHGHRWWELDVTYLMICVLERLGLAWT